MALPSRGEVWQADLDPTRGREQRGRRPVLVVSTDRFTQGPAELVVIVPITSKARGIAWHVRIDPPEGGLKLVSHAMCEMMRSVARQRLSRRIGVVKPSTLKQVEQRLRILLEL